MTSSSTRDRPIRVLCCSGSLEGGGSERQLWQLASKLDRKHFFPSVYLLYKRGIYIERLPADVSVTAFWSEHDENRRYWPGRIRHLQIAHMARIIREHEIDVVYDRTFHMTLVTSAAANRAGVPRVSVIVSPPSADFLNSRERFRFWKKRLLSAAYRQAGCITIAVSEEVADDAVAFYGLARSEIEVMPSPVDVEGVRTASKAEVAVPSRLGQPAPERPNRIAVIGRLSREKGQRLALEAIQLANDQRRIPIHLDLVGDGPDRAELEGLAKKLEISQQVGFHGFLPNPYALLGQSDVLCIPSEYEGLPNVALEAMALGIAVVATDCSGSLRALIGNNERGILVPAGDAPAMARALIDAMGGDAKWQERRRAAVEWVETHHALAPWLTKMGGIFRRVM